jgi:hypothetical protein
VNRASDARRRRRRTDSSSSSLFASRSFRARIGPPTHRRENPADAANSRSRTTSSPAERIINPLATLVAYRRRHLHPARDARRASYKSHRRRSRSYRAFGQLDTPGSRSTLSLSLSLSIYLSISIRSFVSLLVRPYRSSVAFSN